MTIKYSSELLKDLVSVYLGVTYLVKWDLIIINVWMYCMDVYYGYTCVGCKNEKVVKDSSVL